MKEPIRTSVCLQGFCRHESQVHTLGAKPSEFGMGRGKAQGDEGEFKHTPLRPEGFSWRKIHPPDGAS